MNSENYRKLLIDQEVLKNVSDIETFVKSYNCVYEVSDISYIVTERTNSIKRVSEKSEESISIDAFIEQHNKDTDLKNWLYVSKNLVNIYKMKHKYELTCCFLNTHTNDFADVPVEHEVTVVTEVQKLKKH